MFLIIVGGLLSNYIYCSSITFTTDASTFTFFKKFESGRIVGGTPADIREFPYQLSVRTISNRHFCGASIINADWAVSAGHCFYDSNVDLQKYFVVLVSGTSTLYSGGNVHKLEIIKVHPSFDIITLDFDITLIKVKNPFNLALPGVKCIPITNSYIPRNTMAIASGWGILSEKNRYSSNQLQKVSLPIISNKKCKKLFPDKNITQNMLCAGYMKGGKDTCQGDSGGPLIAKNQLIGITSWGKGCARSKKPGVYTNVKEMYNWIVDTVYNNSNVNKIHEEMCILN